MLADSYRMLSQMDYLSLLSLFWYLVLLEIPRYTLAFVAVGLASFRPRREILPGFADSFRISVVVAGHNEANALERCLATMEEQTRKPDEIIVIDDGSSDGMRPLMHRLMREGRITVGLSNQIRCGKAAACNFGMAIARGDIIVNLDADCSYDHDAIELLVQPFIDPKVGAASGNIGVRNSHASCIAGWQSIEYLISISLGKRVLDALDWVVCASGAFAAFRREALFSVGINEPGPGEDLDMTLRLRRAGWKIRFVGEAWCMTDVPTKLGGIIRQRRRWDRDTIRIRLRKFKDMFNPFTRHWETRELLEQCDFLIFNLLVTVGFPVYIAWMFYIFGTNAVLVLIAVTLIYMVVDSLGFFLAFLVTRRRTRPSTLSLLPFAITIGLYNGYFMRCVRLYAYFEEWLFLRSYRDSYVPQEVLNITSMY